MPEPTKADLRQQLAQAANDRAAAEAEREEWRLLFEQHTRLRHFQEPDKSEADQWRDLFAQTLRMRHFPEPAPHEKGQQQVDIPAPRWFIQTAADLLCDLFEQSGGTNFLEWRIAHTRLGPLCLTLQRAEGKTPAELRAEAERERDEANAALRRLEGHANEAL